MKRVLLDTDVFLDFFFDRKPFSDDAANVLALCELQEITGYVTSVIISNIYYLLRKTSRHEKVIEKISQLMTIIEVLNTDKEVIQTALTSRFKNFEDALQNYSAEMGGNIDAVVSRNTKDFKTSKLGVMTPSDFLKILRK